jgi:hypothetical protein
MIPFDHSINIRAYKLYDSSSDYCLNSLFLDAASHTLAVQDMVRHEFSSTETATYELSWYRPDLDFMLCSKKSFQGFANSWQIPAFIFMPFVPSLIGLQPNRLYPFPGSHSPLRDRIWIVGNTDS